MSELNAPTSTDILRSLRLLRSTDPQERMRGIRVLGSVEDDPRVSQVFEHLYETDPDPRVRQAAWHALHQAGPSVPAPGPVPPPRVTDAPEPGSNHTPDPVEHAAERAAGNTPFLFDPANQRILLRERQRRRLRKRGARVPLVIAGVLFVLMVALAVQVAPAARDWVRLRQSGISVPGTVTALESEDDVHRMEVTFATAHDAVESTTHTLRQRVMRAAYQRLAVGDTVLVTYWPDDPALTHTDQPDPAHRLRDREIVAVVVLLGIALLFSGLGLVQYRTRGGKGRRVVFGQIVACAGRVDADGDYKVRIKYRFKSPQTGRVLDNQTRQIRNDLRDVTLPPAGTAIAVYYRSDRAYRLL